MVPSVDFLIIAALDEERETLLAVLPSPERLPPSSEDIFVYYQVVLPVASVGSPRASYRLVIASPVGMGRVNAANLTSAALRRWQPRYVLLIGIAGGFAARGVHVGDVLVSSQVVDYELQKITPEGPSIRMQVHAVNAQLLVASKHVPHSWSDDLRHTPPQPHRPAVHEGVVATGDKVVADDHEKVVQKLLDAWPKLLGVEMEAGGVAATAFQQPQPPGFFMIRSVSDLADADKDRPSTREWRSYACFVAAAYTLALLQSMPVATSQAATRPIVAPSAGRNPNDAAAAQPGDVENSPPHQTLTQNHGGDTTTTGNMADVRGVAIGRDATAVHIENFYLSQPETRSKGVSEGSGSKVAREAELGAGQTMRVPAWVTGPKKVLFNRELGDSWKDLADYLGMPEFKQNRLERGFEGRGIWEWLAQQRRLGELPPALRVLGRAQLAIDVETLE